LAIKTLTIMENKDFTYCNGKGCALKDQCRRYQEGQRIIANVNGDTHQYWWMDNCNEENREGYINN